MVKSKIYQGHLGGLFLRCYAFHFIDHFIDTILQGAACLIGLTFILKALIVSQSADRFFHTTFDFVSCSAHAFLRLAKQSSMKPAPQSAK